jgi:hypothetical protein
MTPKPQTEDELGIAPDPYAHHDQPVCVPDDYDEPRPTPKQLAYLRVLANRTGQTFAYPRTAAQASREIRRLKSTPASSRTEVRIERKQIADAIAAGPADSAAVRVDEVSGHGSTATWAHNRDREPAGPSKSASKRTAPKVGPRTELARYTIAGQARVVFGQRVDGVVSFLPDDLVVLVLGRALNEDGSCRSRSRGSDGSRADAVRRKRPNVVGECDGAAAECLEDRS